MQPSTLHALLALFASTALAQTTRTATVLIPDWCVTQSAPTVTVLGQDSDLTTYSYSCYVDSSAVSSASAKASSIAGDAKSRASELRASLGANLKPTPNVNGDKNEQRSLKNNILFRGKKRDNTCYGYNAFEACIPWEITQGASIWAVHYTVTGIVALDQECTFGPGGVSSGAATCTADGRLDPSIWGNGDGPRTHTFSKNDVDMFWIRNTVAVTAGGTGLAPGTTQLLSGSGSGSGARQTAVAGSGGVQSTGVAAQNSLPTGVVAMAVGAGGVLFAALAL